jgi:hypothetical protein
MKTLKIKWQRLLIEESGRTCPRCSATEKELEKAVHILKQSLAPLGIEVTLEKKALNPVKFSKDILESNRIWIGEKPLEEWLEAEIGQSLCCEVCDNAECRTVEVGKKIYEAIPADLIIKAGLVAASKMVAPEPEEICCEENTSKKMLPGICCPESEVDKKVKV